MPAAAFEQDGFALLHGVLPAERCADIAAGIGMVAGAGSRTLLRQPWCAELASELAGALGGLVPASHAAIQCTYFEKSEATNWLVPIHQDLSLPMPEGPPVPDSPGWALKEDGWYIQPGAEVLAQVVAVRLHLDDCGHADGPLYVVPASHRQGQIPQPQAIAMRSKEQPCLLAAGDILVMRPLLLHRSSRSSGASRRRVLHFLFAPPMLAVGCLPMPLGGKC